MKEEEIFHQALDLPQEQRGAFLVEACGDDEGLRGRVENLLHAHENPGSFLQSPAADEVAPTMGMGGQAETPGAVIGPYKLLEKIGEGGMGVVYMADQTAPVKRRVALKVIKPGMDSRQVIARFEAERQALALMDHPNIARVLDAGTTDAGRPYFVMELVRGISITQFCDEHQLNPRERLELFLTVCQAVQHAHQKGIIHRDIKPSNVLVTLHDDKPLVKVIDFGVAKATNGSLTDKTLFTGFAQMIGTPLYMSPEQASLNGLDVDTRSDIYSLGVLLYELLTGTTPFDRKRLQQAAFDEVRRIIREEEPQKPSTRISSLGDTLPSVSAQRRMEPARLSKEMRGDLDWIVMKALEKDRARRYETANGFAADVQRYFANEPVSACPPSTLYRFRKFAHRNTAALAVGGTALTGLVLLVISLMVSNQMLTKSRSETTLALRQKELALQDATNSAKQAAQSEAVANRERRRAELNFEKARIAVSRLLTSPAMGYHGWQQVPTPLRKVFADAATEYYDSIISVDGSTSSQHLEAAIAQRSLGDISRSIQDHDRAIELYRRAIETFEDLLQQSPSNMACAQQLAWSYQCMYSSLGNDEIQKDYAAQRCDEIYQKYLDRLGPSGSQDARIALYNLTNAEKNRRRIDSSDHFLQRCRAAHDRLFQPLREESDLHADWSLVLARLYAHRNRPQDATALAEQAVQVAPKQIDIACKAGAIYLAMGDVDRYVHLCRQLQQQSDLRNSTPSKSAEILAQLFLLAPNAMNEHVWIAALLDDAMSVGDGDRDDSALQFTRGLFNLRAGESDRAIERLLTLASDAPKARRIGVLSALAIAQHRLGRVDEARASLESAGELLSHRTDIMHADWMEWTQGKVLFDEALAVSEGSPKPLPMSMQGDVADKVNPEKSDETEGDVSDVSPSKQRVEILSRYATLRNHTDVVRMVAFLPGDQQLISVDNQRRVMVWDLSSRCLHSQFELTSAGYCIDADLSRDGKLLAVSMPKGTAGQVSVEVWDITNQSKLHSMPLDFKYMNRIRFSPSGKQIAIVGNPPRAELWDVESEQKLQSLDLAETNASVAIKISPNGRLLAKGLVGRVRFFDLERKSETWETKLAHNRAVTDVAFAPDGTQLVVAQMGGHISLIDAASGKLINTLQGKHDAALCVQFLPNPRYLLSTFTDSTVNVWDLQEKRIVATAPIFKATNCELAVSNNGRYAATAGGELWDEKSKKTKKYSDYAIRVWQLPALTPVAIGPVEVEANGAEDVPTKSN